MHNTKKKRDVPHVLTSLADSVRSLEEFYRSSFELYPPRLDSPNISSERDVRDLSRRTGAVALLQRDVGRDVSFSRRDVTHRPLRKSDLFRPPLCFWGSDLPPSLSEGDAQWLDVPPRDAQEDANKEARRAIRSAILALHDLTQSAQRPDER